MLKRQAVRATGRFQRKREAILAASIELINREGLKGLTLSDAGAAVGLSTTSVTYYFKRKDDLAAACLQRGVEELQAMADLALAEPTPKARLRVLLDLFFERQRRIALGEATPLPVLNDLRALGEPQKSEVFAAYMRLFRAVRGLFEAPDMIWLGRGRRTARTYLLLEQIFWTAAWLPKRAPGDYPAVADALFDILTDGLARPGAEWTPRPLPSPERMRRDRSETSGETFLLAATRLINSRGYRGASVDKISAELNVTKGSFYHHNDAKDDLVVACFERTFEVMRRAQRQAAALPGDAWRQLTSAGAAVIEHQLSSQGPLLRASALSVVPETIRKELVDQSDRISAVFAEMIARGFEDGSIRRVDASIAAQMINATLNAGAELAYWVPGLSQKRAASVFLRPLMMGLFTH